MYSILFSTGVLLWLHNFASAQPLPLLTNVLPLWNNIFRYETWKTNYKKREFSFDAQITLILILFVRCACSNPKMIVNNMIWFMLLMTIKKMCLDILIVMFTWYSKYLPFLLGQSYRWLITSKIWIWRGLLRPNDKQVPQLQFYWLSQLN